MESVHASEPSEGRPSPPSEDDEELPTDEESTTNRSRMAHTSTCSNREQFIAEQEILIGKLENLRESLVKPVIGYAVVLMLLSQQTFRSYTQPPAGLDEHGRMQTGVPIMLYSIFSSMSFYTSVSALVLCVGCFVPKRLRVLSKLGNNALRAHRTMSQEKMTEVTVLLMKVVGVNAMLVVSVCFCVGAHAAAGFAVTPSQSINRLTVLITTIVGGWMFSSCALSLLQDALQYARYDRESRIGQILHILVAMVFALLSSLPFTGLFLSYAGGCCQSFFPNLEDRFSDTFLRHKFEFWRELVEEMTEKRPWCSSSSSSSHRRESAVYQNPTFHPFMQQQSSYSERVPSLLKPELSGL
ncbi:hypothetical protein MPTK1_7g15880 [Marchantia polymorpha subsp. ruderalis]